jgi:hypothetical protein
VTWSASSGAAAYELQASPNGSTGWTNVNTNVSGVTTTHTGLQADTDYYYRVRSKNSGGELSGYSSPSLVVKTLQGAPSNVTGLTAISTSTTQINLSWTAGASFNSSYKIAYQSGATFPPDCNTGTIVTSGGTSVNISSGLTGSSIGQYSFRVCALNGNSTPDMSSGTTITWKVMPPNPTAGSPSVALNATTPTTKVDLAWTSGAGSTDSYIIAFRSGPTAPDNCSSGTLETSSSVTKLIEGLTANTQYSFRICAVNDNSAAETSSGFVPSSITTNQVAPGNPSDLAVSASTSATVALTWTAGSNATSYRIAYQQTSAPLDCSSGNVVTSSTNSVLINTFLSPSTTYGFRVCSVNSNPSPDVSSGETISQDTSAPPSDPTDVTATASSATAINIAWSSGGTVKIAYRTGSNPPDCDTGMTSTSSSTPTTITSGINAATQYFFKVCALDANSVASSGVSVNATTNADSDSSYSGVSLLHKYEGANSSTTFSDASNYFHNATAAGGAISLSTFKSKFGVSSLYSDGTSYLTIPANEAFVFGTGNFTFEGWFNNDGSKTTRQALFGTEGGDNQWTDSARFNVWLRGYSNQSNFEIHHSGNSGGPIISFPISVYLDGNWHHFAISRASGVWNVYINGSHMASYSHSNAASLGATGQSLVIGSSGLFDSGARAMKGYLDELRITKGVARYTGTSSFTPSTSAFPIVPTATSSSSVALDGSDDFVSVAANTALNPTNTISFGAWSKVVGTGRAEGSGNSYVKLLSKGLAGGDPFSSYYIGFETTNPAGETGDPTGTYSCRVSINTTQYVVTSTSTFSSSSDWHHIMCVYGNSDNTSSKLKIYVNGTEQRSITLTGDINHSLSDNSLRIGQWGFDDGSYVYWRAFRGYLDDVRIYNTAISPANVASIYNSGNGSVTAVAAGLVGWWKFDENTGSSAANSGTAGSVLNGTFTNGPGWISGK